MAHWSISKIVTRSAVSKYSTRLYPFEKREPFKNTRGSIAIDIQACKFDTVCAKRCPTDAITVKRKERVWEIDRLRCIACGACVEICPAKALTMETMYSPAVTVKEVESYRYAPEPLELLRMPLSDLKKEDED
jgi:ech hydrogenase subunit F